ncbi:hypothetical protein RFI_30390 [Reticulomyxa filosa]|uniref:Uncharacterized protein n=1 Tax=Reticulomyxa filosa TaxID=46433 RepID=X6M0R9_RETFI|nr:hypothetical protein RFI_30390 [Reticulomyxa filosa]|eukprot:ETO07002.1 hypothetical protein RFI_30390 [Reticulomyxa filosa]
MFGSAVIKLLTVIRVCSLLLEDILSIYYQGKGDHQIFWIMYGFGVAAGVAEALSMLHFCLEIFGAIALEVSQAVLFMWACNWSKESILIFAIIGSVQLGLFVFFYTLQCIESWYEKLHEKEESSEEEDVAKYAQMCTKCCFPALIGIGILPYLYFSNDTFFRARWFDICIAVSLWLSGIQLDIQRRTMGGKKDVPWYYSIPLIFSYLWAIAFGLLTYILCIDFVKNRKWSNNFEKGYTIFIVSAYSFGVCCENLFVYKLLMFRTFLDDLKQKQL